MAELNKTKALSKPPQEISLSGQKTLIVMAKLAETISYRGAEGSPKYLELMAERLSKENREYLFQALTKLGERKREQGETALLDLGTILEEMRLLTPRKKSQVELEDEMMWEERRKAIKAIEHE